MKEEIEKLIEKMGDRQKERAEILNNKELNNSFKGIISSDYNLTLSFIMELKEIIKTK